MQFIVKAVALDIDTGEPLVPAREETIDTTTNALFEGLTHEAEIEDRYEEFWNRLNGFTNDLPDGKVKVLTVTRAEG